MLRVLNADFDPSSQAALARIIVPACMRSISVEAWPVFHNALRLDVPPQKRHARNASDNSEKNGSSHASTDKSHLPSESIPGCFIATEIDTAMIIDVRGTAHTGVMIISGTK